MPITRIQLKQQIQLALDTRADVNITPAAAREAIASDLANAFADYVDGRATTVTGTSASGGAVTGTGVINGS